jgi:hypothetical protein
LITTMVCCQSKTESGEGDDRQALLSFAPDYTDGRNKEWSRYTPHLSLSMTVKGSVADDFQPGKAYTLTFEESA